MPEILAFEHRSWVGCERGPFWPFLPAPRRTGLDTCRIIRLSGFLVSLTLAYFASVLDNVQDRFGSSHLAYLDVLSMGNLPHFAVGLL